MNNLWLKLKNSKIDWMITIVPLVIIIILCILFITMPTQSNNILSKIRFFFGDKLGSYYLIIGIVVLILAFVIAFSKIGNIVLGNKGEKHKYSFFSWGSMMFTCGLAADILFYSFAEWIMYASDPHLGELAQNSNYNQTIQEWAGVFPLFHWSFIPWAFYLVLAVAFGFMMHVRRRNRQRFSESCRPLLGKQTDKIPGRVIDLFAVFALLAGTATTFTIATPLMASIIETLFNITVDRKIITIIILVVTFIVYTYSLLHGFKGISILAKSCIFLFFGLLLFVLFFTGSFQYIVDTGIESFGKMIQNFIGLATTTDPNRVTSFPQNWTIYYWAYWMVWCVAAPFFIGNISRGRTIRQTIIGGLGFGVGSTVISFIILGNYSMKLQVKEVIDLVNMYKESGDIYQIIITIIKTMPLANFILVLVLVTMMLFYATSFDSIAYTASCYSYKVLSENEKPKWTIQLLWCILLIILPIALIFSESSMTNLQSLSIVSAFPIGIIMILIIISFFIDSKKFLEEDIKTE